VTEARISGLVAELATPEFTLLEEENDNIGYSRPTLAIPRSGLTGMDDMAESSPTYGERFEEAATTPEFGASPVLISCLRDIARMPKRNN